MKLNDVKQWSKDHAVYITAYSIGSAIGITSAIFLYKTGYKKGLNKGYKVGHHQYQEQLRESPLKINSIRDGMK